MSNVRVVFVYKMPMYKKEKFYGCEKLYFTELFYERKRKARARKENYSIAPLRSCFVTVSVFVGTSVVSLRIKRSRPGFGVCATSPRHHRHHRPPALNDLFTGLICFCRVRRAAAQERRTARSRTSSACVVPLCFRGNKWT